MGDAVKFLLGILLLIAILVLVLDQIEIHLLKSQLATLRTERVNGRERLQDEFRRLDDQCFEWSEELEECRAACDLVSLELSVCELYCPIYLDESESYMR